jgi:hypothetical protein
LATFEAAFLESHSKNSSLIRIQAIQCIFYGASRILKHRKEHRTLELRNFQHSIFVTVICDCQDFSSMGTPWLEMPTLLKLQKSRKNEA